MSSSNASPTFPAPQITTCDPVWTQLVDAAAQMKAEEPLMAAMLHEFVLSRPSFEAALSARLASKLGGKEMSEAILRELFAASFARKPALGAMARADISAVVDRDPACNSPIEPMLFLKGFLALQGSRIAHLLWQEDRKPLAQFLQMRITEVFSVDIHPGAQIGRGVMIDHATGVVIGETAVVGNDVSILHSVTLGGTGKDTGDRHPKIGNGVLIGAGAKILGNIQIGACSRVGAGSVVLAEVPPCKTVAGVPAKVVGDAGCSHPSQSMDHTFDGCGEGV